MNAIISEFSKVDFRLSPIKDAERVLKHRGAAELRQDFCDFTLKFLSELNQNEEYHKLISPIADSSASKEKKSDIIIESRKLIMKKFNNKLKKGNSILTVFLKELIKKPAAGNLIYCYAEDIGTLFLSIKKYPFGDIESAEYRINVCLSSLVNRFFCFLGQRGTSSLYKRYCRLRHNPQKTGCKTKQAAEKKAPRSAGNNIKRAKPGGSARRVGGRIAEEGGEGIFRRARRVLTEAGEFFTKNWRKAARIIFP